MSFKPVCAAKQTIAAIQGFRELVAAGLDADAARGVTVAVPSAYREMIDRTAFPVARQDSLSNVRYSFALAVAAPERLLDVHRNELVDTPRIRALMAKVEVAIDPALDAAYPRDWPARVTVTAGDGSVHERTVMRPFGDPGTGFGWDAATEKFAAIAPHADAAAIAAACRGLGTRDAARAARRRGERAAMTLPQAPYDPRTARYLCFADARAAFAAGSDDPSAFLERCLERIAQREPQRARVRVARSGRRAQRRRSIRRTLAPRRTALVVDGMPVGIKDCYDVAACRRASTAISSPDHRAQIDAAHVDALRRGGAIIRRQDGDHRTDDGGSRPDLEPLGLAPHARRLVFGLGGGGRRRMLPLATGSQVRGSTIRPASICGIVGMKPTYGALNRNGGFDPSPSLNHLGLLGGTLTDVWETARFLAREAGGDPGHLALAGADAAAVRAAPAAARAPIHGGLAAHRRRVESRVRSVSAYDSRRAGSTSSSPTRAPSLRAYEDATAARAASSSST